jgi:hypothetical protein
MPNLNSLVDLANRDGVDIRPTLLRVMTDLYVQKPMHSSDEERHYTELALRLIDLVDARTRAIVAEKIVAYAGAPAAVRQRLSREQIVRNAASEAAAAGGSPASAAAELSELFFVASTDERRLILLNLPYASLPPAAPLPAAVAAESVHRLEAAALGHNAEMFARELARTLAISRLHARRLIEDPSGEAIVVVALALKMPAAVLQRILLCLNPAISQSVQRVYELSTLYEDIEPEAALRLIAIWQASHPAQRTAALPHAPGLQPQHSPDEQATRPEPLAPPTRPKVRWEEYAGNRRDSA